METTSSYPPTGVSVHTGFFYDTTGQYLDVISSFLEEGLKAGEPALVAVPHGNLEMIRARLGSSGGTVRFRDMSVLGRNPSRIIPAVRRFADAHRGVRTRFVGEPLGAGARQRRSRKPPGTKRSSTRRLLTCPRPSCALTRPLGWTRPCSPMPRRPILSCWATAARE